jgi:hypothetical protein
MAGFVLAISSDAVPRPMAVTSLAVMVTLGRGRIDAV